MTEYLPGDRVFYVQDTDRAFYGKWATVVTAEEFQAARSTPLHDGLIPVRFDELLFGESVWSTSPDTICPEFDSITKIEEFLK